jgi:hypothetical protein
MRIVLRFKDGRSCSPRFGLRALGPVVPTRRNRMPSQPRRSDDRVPEEHTKKRNHNDPKDQALRVATTGLVVPGSQPVGIAHAILFGRPPASQPYQTLINDFLNVSFRYRRSQTPQGAFDQPPDTQFGAAGWRGS